MRYRSLLLLAVLLVSATCRPAAAADQPTMADLVRGVSRIAVTGTPGPVQAYQPEWTVIAADAATPAGFVEARPFGKGRVVAVGHEGLLQPGTLALFDNKRFLSNTLAWLAPPGRRQIAVAQGHAEFVTAQALQSSGYSVTGLDGILTRKALDAAGILIIGNAWGAFTEAEIRLVTEFVREGGGLLLAGLGWSWRDYAADSSKREYPMNVVGAPFGIRWLPGVIVDAASSADGITTLTSFYPTASEANELQDFALLERLCTSHPKDLPDFLEKDRTAREQVFQALQRTDGAVRAAADADVSRRIFALSGKLVRLCPQYFSAEPTYNQKSTPTIGAVRDRFLANWVLSQPGTATARKEIAEGARLQGTRLEIWDRFGIFVMDNHQLSQPQVTIVQNILNLMAPPPPQLRFITVSDEGENAFADYPARTISLFRYWPGQYVENALPVDAQWAMVDVFSSAVVHELHHFIDYFSSALVKARRDVLLAAAGNQDLNYIRSQITAKYFQEHPGEFVASLSNAWSADSRKVLALSLSRFDRGYKGPVNQMLFMADLYTQGKETTYFYRNDTQGLLQRTAVPVARDKQGRITRLTVDGASYDFTLNESGDVTGYRITRK